MPKKRLTVLAIDDDVADLKILRTHLSRFTAWDVEVLEFTKWEEARKELKRRAVDVILVDYLLGKETGLDVVREIRGNGDERPVIVLTGQGDEFIAAEVTRAGANDYLVKQQLDPDALRRAIENAMTQFQLRQEKALLEEELQQSQKMETIGTLAGGLAHDFNNILMAVMGCLELALIKSKGREIAHDLAQAQSACKQMAELVQRLLSFSRRGSSDKSQVNLVQIIREVEAILAHTISKKVELQVDVPDEALTLNANSAMLHQVLLNLSLNASEAMPDGGKLVISARQTDLDKSFVVSHPESSLGENILLQVTDSGIGMDKETIARVFDPFFTTKQLGSRKGTGLGLSVVWQNVRSHNGFITVYSEPDGGTTFQIYLPVTKPASEAQEVKREPDSELPEGNETILVVDDEPILRDLTSRMLQKLGYKVYVASDGVMALETYTKIPGEIGVVLLDISMPKMDGRECLARLIEMEPNVRVLLASGHDMTDEIESLKALGAKDVVQKPFSLDDLAHRLRAILDK